MLTRIQCESFRGLRSLEAPVGEITAFLGPNSSGKTTVLHGVRLACKLLQRALETEYRLRVQDGWVVVTRDTLITAASLLPLADWRALFVDQEVGEGVRFSIVLTFTETDTIQALSVEVACAHNQQLKLQVRVRSQAALDAIAGLSPTSSHVHPRLSAVITADAPEAVLVPPFYGTVPDEEYRARTVIDRLLGSGDQSHVVRNLVAALEPEQFTRLNSFLQGALGASLTYRTTGDALQTESPLQVRFQDSNGEIELSAAGAGLVNLVALFCALSRWRRTAADKPVLFLLDEPEAHLHPRLQAEATAQLGRLVVGEFGAQLLLATHSVDILNRLAAEGATLLRVERTARPSAVVLHSDTQLFEDLRSWVDLTPYTAINFLAARRVLFCEGTGDKDTLAVLARLRYRNDPARLRRFLAWTRARLQGASKQPLATMLAALVRNEAVQTQTPSTAFRVLVVLDRDHIRSPGRRIESLDGVEETTVVWSRHSIESVLLTPEALRAWVLGWIETWRARSPGPRAAYGAPPDLPARIDAALSAANTDGTLNTFAIEQLTAHNATRELLDENERKLGGPQKVIHAMRQATEAVTANPEVWQRGKDRAAVVLGAIRSGLDLPARNSFPTDILRLIADTDVDRVGNAQTAIPAEIADLLDAMVRS